MRPRLGDIRKRVKFSWPHLFGMKFTRIEEVYTLENNVEKWKVIKINGEFVKEPKISGYSSSSSIPDSGYSGTSTGGAGATGYSGYSGIRDPFAHSGHTMYKKDTR